MFSNEAFAQNAEKYMDTVFRVAYGWLKNPDDANDVTQDVLIELYKTDKAFESDAHLKNWLIRVTVNRCKMLFRSPWRRHEDIDLRAAAGRRALQSRDGTRQKIPCAAAALLLRGVYNGGSRVDARHSRKDRQHKTFSRKGEAQNDFGGGVKQ
jgi:RNA polymerase sigma factor (sigma-70 family)